MDPQLERKLANPVCRECIKTHLSKYDDFVDEEGIVHGGFTVPCEGIPTKYLSDHLEAILDDESKSEAIGLFDPVTWAKEWIKLPDGSPWIARWYQEQMLRCTASRRITRCGRRTGKTDALAVHILHYCFTNKNRRVLIVAPYKSQTEEIISRIRGFISTNSKLIASVSRDVSSPFYELKFKNGSRIRGFSSGTKSGAEGVAIRGQDADRIYLDEADYLTDGDLKAIVAILNTHANVELWASSTPSGRRAHFWRWCTKTPSYKEFYYPSSVLPFWEEVKDQIRADYIGNHDAWVHEILAEFGEQTVGVFQHQYTDHAITEYKYDEMSHKPGWVYSIGVDWNSEFGTEIVVVGYNKRGRFRIVDALNIPKQNWTQLAGIEAIIEMNARWRPTFIYVDEGAGTTNIELLRKYGYDMIGQDKKDPACQLKDIVKGYNFSAKIDARDPMTKRPIKKHAKPFMVENAVRFFEERRIEISAFDMALRNQLENYIIKHRTTAGVPVYGLIEERIGDHRLDAMMLALVGYKLEMSDFGKAYHTTHIAVSPGFARLRKKDESSPEKELERRLDRMPQTRYEEDNQPFVTKSTVDLPAKVSSDRDIQVYRHGFMTDEEEKYKAKYRLRNMRKRSRFHKIHPERTNI
jgi:replicative DNA helicase